jgi:hypothetical protein
VLFTAVYPLPKGGSGLVFAAGSVTPSKFVKRLPWDSESSAGFDFTSLKQKKVHRSDIQRRGRLADRLDAFATIKSLVLHPSTKTDPGTTI